MYLREQTLKINIQFKLTFYIVSFQIVEIITFWGNRCHLVKHLSSTDQLRG